jgi:hypothetical protein
MTVVPEFAGTITVVLLLCGAGGLLLLMHPETAASTTSEASIVFMMNPLTSFPEHIWSGISMKLSAVALNSSAARDRPSVTSYSCPINAVSAASTCSLRAQS